MVRVIISKAANFLVIERVIHSAISDMIVMGAFKPTVYDQKSKNRLKKQF